VQNTQSQDVLSIYVNMGTFMSSKD